MRHAVVYHEDFRINPLPDDHRFPMPKDHLLWERLQSLGLASRTFTPQYPDTDTLCLVHEERYVRGFMSGMLTAAEMRRIGLPWSPALAQRTAIGVGSAIMAARLALAYGVAVMCNGGTHHAHRSHGSGWCIFNDQAVAARSVQRDAAVERVLFVGGIFAVVSAVLLCLSTNAAGCVVLQIWTCIRGMALLPSLQMTHQVCAESSPTAVTLQLFMLSGLTVHHL